MPETVEMDVPSAFESWLPSCCTCERVWESVPMESPSAWASEPAEPLTCESVVRASATVVRVCEMRSCVPSRSSARLPSSDWTSERSAETDVAALSASPSSVEERPWSFSVMTLATVSTNVLEIWLSSVVAPVSVTLGEMALTFSFT